jgi:hypothetical protein
MVLQISAPTATAGSSSMKRTALRDADAGRAAGVTPTGQHGVIADVSLGSDLSDSFIVSGGVGANMEGTVSTAIAYRITNQSGGTSTVAVTITALPLET